MDDRRDDWRTGVDQNLVSLNTAQRVTDQQLDDLDLKYEAIDKVLRGDPETDTDGFIARLHNAENAILELRAERVKFKVADVTVTGFKWEFLTKVTVQLLILAGFLILGWDKLEGLYQKIIHQEPSLLEKKIERARHPKSPKKMYRVRVVPSGATSETPSVEPSEEKP